MMNNKLLIKVITIILLTVFLFGCSNNKEEYICISNTELKGVKREITYSSSNGIVKTIVMTLKVDTSYKDMGNVGLIQLALMEEAPFYKEHKKGLDYEFSSTGTIVTEVMMINLEEIAKPVMEELDICSEEILEGNDKGFKINSEALKKDLEEQNYKATCTLKDGSN